MAQPSIHDLLPRLASAAPHTHALGLELAGVEGDVVTLRAPYRDDLVGDPRSLVLAGGVVTTLLDHVGGLAVWTAMGGYAPIATLDMRIDYMRAADPGLDVYARARCYKLTRSIAFVRAWAYDRDPDDPVAAAQSAYMLNEGAAGRAERGAGA